MADSVERAEPAGRSAADAGAGNSAVDPAEARGSKPAPAPARAWAAVVADLVRAHQGEVWAYLRVLGADPAAADDLTQETFMAVLRAPFEVREPRAVAAYLRTAARHRFLSAVRAARARPRFADADLDRIEAAFEARGGLGPRQEALRRCLERLPARSRAVLERRYQGGEASRAIAAALGLEPAHVDTLAHRAKGALKRCIEERLRDG